MPSYPVTVSTPPTEKDPEGLRVTWGGHATVLLELDGVRLLTDPVLRNRVLHLTRHVPAPGPGLLRDPDAILISHLHHDHLDLPSLKRFGRGVRVIAPVGSGTLLRRAGFVNVVELRAGERTAVGSVEVTAVHAEHDGRRYPFGTEVYALGYELAGRQRIYFAGDTDIHPDLGVSVTRPDLALLPIWGWGHRLGAGHMDPRGAARAAALLEPGLTIPIHWGTYFPLGMKRIRGGLLESPARAFADQMAELAPGREYRVLRPGESVALPPGGEASP